MPGTALLIADLLAENDPQYAVVTSYISSYKAKYDQDVSAFGGYAHDAFALMTDAMARAGSDDPSDIRDALEATSGLVGTTGIYTFSPEDHLGLDLSAFRMLEIKDGRWTSAD